MPDSVYNPFTDAEEVLFKDVDGQLKVVRQGGVAPWQPSEAVVSGAMSAPSAPDPLEQLADRVVAELKLALPDDILRKRFRSTVMSRLKDVRDQIETRETLTRPTKVGGMGLSPENAESAVKLIERYYQQYRDRERKSLDQSLKEIEASVGTPSPSIDAPAPMVSSQISTPPPAIPLPRAAPPVPGPLAAPPASLTAPRPRPIFRLMPLPVSTFPEASPLPPYRPQPSVPPRPLPSSVQPPAPPTSARISPPPALPVPPPTLRMERPGELPSLAKPPLMPPQPEPSAIPRDATEPPPVPPLQPPTPLPPTEPAPPAAPPVRPRPKLVGPLEELREMTLVDFRRLDEDPVKATNRIREKIAILEQQSFGHKAAAIAAWRGSGVFKRYAELAAAAMAEKKSVGEVIKSRQSAGSEVISVAEFEAMADFNRTLRF